MGKTHLGYDRNTKHKAHKHSELTTVNSGLHWWLQVTIFKKERKKHVYSYLSTGIVLILNKKIKRNYWAKQWGLFFLTWEKLDDLHYNLYNLVGCCGFNLCCVPNCCHFPSIELTIILQWLKVSASLYQKLDYKIRNERKKMILTSKNVCVIYMFSWLSFSYLFVHKIYQNVQRP